MTSEWLDIYLSNEISTDNPDIPLNDYFNLNGFGSQYLLINLASSVVYMFIYWAIYTKFNYYQHVPSLSQDRTEFSFFCLSATFLSGFSICKKIIITFYLAGNGFAIGWSQN